MHNNTKNRVNIFSFDALNDNTNILSRLSHRIPAPYTEILCAKAFKENLSIHYQIIKYTNAFGTKPGQDTKSVVRRLNVRHYTNIRCLRTKIH